MAVSLRFQDRLLGELEPRLAAKGFLKADTAKLQSIMVEKKYDGQPLVYPNERIYALNLHNQKPLFFVFVKRDDRPGQDSDSVSILASNPREDILASRLPLEKQYFRHTYSSGNPVQLAEKIVDALSELASTKTLHRMQVHFHSREMLNGTIAFDDGVSRMADIIRRAILHNVDVLAYTPHNSFAMDNCDWMNAFLREFGIAAPLASEITMPLAPGHPNGPHHLILAAGKDAADEIRMRIFHRRDHNLEMESYFTGMTMDEMYSVLAPLRAANQAIVGIAHPVNCNTEALPVRGIGLFSATQQRHLAYEQAFVYARYTDFVECWNDSIYMGEMPFRSMDFLERMRGLLRKHSAQLGLPQDLKMSANLCNLLVATELGERFGLGQSYGTDAHVEAPLHRSYRVGGDSFSRGWTTLEVPESLMHGRPISAGEFVHGISDKTIKMGAVMFTQVSDGLLKIVDARTQRPEPLDEVIRHQARKLNKRYRTQLINDFFGFAVFGELEELGRMAE
jgi:hypothetical protein